MPFLRAARIKRGLTPQAEQEEILKPPVAVPAEIEEAEKEPEFEPAKIKELHRLIDEKVDEKNEKTEELVTEDSGDSVNVPDVPEEQEQDLTPEPEVEIQEIEEIQESTAEVQEIQETGEIEQPEELKELEEPEEPEIPEVIEVVEVLEIPEIPDIPEIELADITEDLTSETAIEIPAVEITEDETEQEQAVETETEAEPETESEIEIETEKESESGTEEAAEEAKSEVFDENSLLDDADDNHEDIISIIEPEPEIETEQEQEQEAEQEQEQPVTEPEEPKEPEEFKLKYDFTSGERYVDKVSTKTEFDKVLDELSAISKDLLSWQVEKFARDYTNKFHDENDKSDSDAKKYEAFLGGYITNAAMILYDNGYRDAAIKQLDQAKSILEARKKLENETLAIKTRVEEEDATVDLSDILGLFGDA